MQNQTLHLDFARGLLEEAKGNPVDWSAFAMLRCFPYHKKRKNEPWGPYVKVRRPLPWLHPKCLPADVRNLSQQTCEAHPTHNNTVVTSNGAAIR
ncbi:hypothetical protein M758_UG007700 [Ceratodon purpureus]|nr:hypothetical protein M758_UG007700 [Ceratodon purpureus]